MRCTPFGIFSVIASVSGVSSVVRSSSVPAKLSGGIPRCLVEPAEGSRSMTSDEYPFSPSAVAKWTVLVLFPTPPFWFPTAMTTPGLIRGIGSLLGIFLPYVFMHPCLHGCMSACMHALMGTSIHACMDGWMHCKINDLRLLLLKFPVEIRWKKG